MFFKVTVRGRNFSLREKNAEEKFCFVTDIAVDAKEEEEAKTRAIEILQEKLKDKIQKRENDEPLLFNEKVMKTDKKEPFSGVFWQKEVENEINLNL